MWLTDEKIPFDTRAKYVIITFCIGPLIFLIIYSLFLPSECEIFLKDEFRGVVIDKYRDRPNHNIETIVIRKHGEEKLTKFVNPSDRDFYEIININDSLIKKGGISFLTIKRDDSVFVHKMHFRCDENKINTPELPQRLVLKSHVRKTFSI